MNRNKIIRRILSLMALLLVAASFSTIAQQVRVTTKTAQASDSEWTLVFSDEFNDTALNKEAWITWFPYTNDGSDQCAFCRTHGDENQVFLDRNIVIKDGILNIVAKREKFEWMGEQRDYTSGMVHARNAYGHGRYEVRSRLPAGEGLWPAIWTFGQKSAEVDIMEAGMQNPVRFHASVHNWLIKKMKHKRLKIGVDLTNDFHVYAMEWDENSIQFFFDDTKVWELCRYATRRGNNPRKCNVRKKSYLQQPVFPPDDEKLYLIIGMAIGNETTPFTGTPKETTVFPNQLQVDYIRIYEKKN